MKHFSDVDTFSNNVVFDFSKIIPCLQKQYFSTNDKNYNFSKYDCMVMLWIVVVLIENVRMSEQGVLSENMTESIDLAVHEKVDALQKEDIPCQCVIMFMNLAKEDVKKLCDVSDMRWFDYVSDA